MENNVMLAMCSFPMCIYIPNYNSTVGISPTGLLHLDGK